MAELYKGLNLYDTYDSLKQFGDLTGGMKFPTPVTDSSNAFVPNPGTGFVPNPAAMNTPMGSYDPSVWDTFKSNFKGINWLDSIDPKTGLKTDGALKYGMGAAQGLFNGWLGMKQLDLANRSLANSEKQFNLNFDAQRKMTNSQLEDRQRVRNRENPNSVSVAEYMAKWGV